MAKRSSSGPEILLGLLTIEPMSGYDLRQTIHGSVGHFWNETYGQIYPNLKKLASEGCVKSRTERQKGKPDRHVFSITDKGRERLRNWLAVPPQPEIPRNEMLLKLFLGEQTSPEILIRYVEDMAQQCRTLLATLEQTVREGIDANRHYPAAPYWKMAACYGQMEMQAHLRWAEKTLAELRIIRAKQAGDLAARKETQHANR